VREARQVIQRVGETRHDLPLGARAHVSARSFVVRLRKLSYSASETQMTFFPNIQL